MFDYVIVGGGSAGCVLAARLAEDPDCRVLLLEAGPEAVAGPVPPASPARLLRGRYDWSYVTVPQEGAGGRLVYWPRGRVLGGTSALGGPAYLRGHRADFDHWRDEFGCAGWGFRDLLPYFRRAEGSARGASGYHGGAGPLPVRDPRFRTRQATDFVAAAVRQGVPAAGDFNAGEPDGVGFYPVIQAGGRRCSVADAYLPARPANLTVLTRAQVTGLVIEGGRAAGVRYRRHGADATARAAAEVVLAAGAIGTPQLLMLSGLGPADHLRAHGIAVLADLPAVGANLADPPAVPVQWATPAVRGPWESSGLVGVARWRLTGRGPLTAAVAEAGGFARSDPHRDRPDLQWQVLPFGYRAQGRSEPARRSMTVLASLAGVASRGQLRLASPDPRHRPLIDPGYLADERDLAALAAGVAMARDFATAAPLAATCRSELSPGPGVRAEHEVRAFIRSAVVSGHQAVGTCAMGGDIARSASGYDSVTDPQLRVRGVTGLRVVDASVMPAPPCGGLLAAVTALAERAADLIAGRAPLVPTDPATTGALPAIR